VNLAIIPARGGSKGIPRKNIQLIGGVPLVVHSIRHALEAGCVDRIVVFVVSTDDNEIAAVSSGAGAEVIRRPLELAGDTASSESALLHVLDTLRDQGDGEPNLVIFLQATSPIRRWEDIDGVVGLVQEAGYDSVFSASPAHGFVWELGSGGSAVPLTYNPSDRPMRQQVGQRVMENGSIYVFRPWVLRETGCRLGGRIGVYQMGLFEALQVDEPEDLELAEWLLERWSPHLAGSV